MIRSFQVGIGPPPLRRLGAALGLLFVGSLSSAVHAQAVVAPAYPGGPYIYIPSGQPQASAGPPIAAGWEKLGDGIVENEPGGRATARTDRVDDRRAEGSSDSRRSNLDVRFTAHGWVVVWDRLVPLTDLSRDGSLYILHPQGNGHVRIALEGRELFRDVLFARKYEDARSLLEGR
jgi:hypothetical protein